MSLLGMTLVLAAACCHAGWNFLVKRINGGAELVWLFSLLSVVLYFPLAAYLLVARAMVFDAAQAVFIAGSAALHLGYFLLLQKGYRHGDLSLVYPLARAAGPLLSSVLAIAFLGERPNAQVVVGGAAIIIGVLCLTARFSLKAGGLSQHAPSSLLFGLGAGVLIGGYTVWDAYAVSVLLIHPLLLDYASACSRCVLLAPFAARRKTKITAHWRQHRAAVIGIAILNPLAYILVLYALTFTPVIYVAPVRETSILMSVLLGALLLGEQNLRQRFRWALLILLGVAVLTAA